MKSILKLRLRTTPAQRQRLDDLQEVFAQACNALASVVQRTRCWNRVALHHMAYRELRQRFPGIGSQMACNAIYSVCRASRLIYQHPNSPFNIARLGEKPLPLLRFGAQAPVYFDRHTLSIKAGEVSMFTLDGRLRFQLDLTEEQERRFREHKLREIVMTSQAGELALTFAFAGAAPNDAAELVPDAQGSSELPEYLVVVDEQPSTLPLTTQSATVAPTQTP